MAYVSIIWDLPDDPEGNLRHIEDGHDVTLEEVEEVLRDPEAATTTSRSSGRPMKIGWTSTGQHIVVVFEHIEDDPMTARPVTAYPVEPPARRQGRRRKR